MKAHSSTQRWMSETISRLTALVCQCPRAARGCGTLSATVRAQGALPAEGSAVGARRVRAVEINTDSIDR